MMDQQHLKPFLAPDVGHPQRAAKHPAAPWFVVAAKPKHEAEASQALMGVCIETYLPMYPTEVPHGRGRMRRVNKPMFGRYFFVRCLPTPETWASITRAPGVCRLLSSRGADGDIAPMPVPEDAIDVVRLLETELAAEPVFGPGDVVRIKRGPFASLYAELTSAVDADQKVSALVDIMGRKTPLNVSASDLAHASNRVAS
jgi:transcription antitermination factor NusG